MAAEAEHLDPAWLAAAQPGRVVCWRPGTSIELEIDAPLERLSDLVALLAAGPTAETVRRLVDSPPEDAERTLETLREHGALVPGPAPPDPAPGIALGEAILRAAREEPLEVTWTASEVLVIPESAPDDVRRRAVRWFVAGLADDERLTAYGVVAAGGRQTVAGDRPADEALAQALRRAGDEDPRTVRVAALGGGAVASLEPGLLGQLGVEKPHRLGPLRGVGPIEVGPPLGPLRRPYLARYAVGNLASPLPAANRVGRGTTPSAELSELLARAEAAERFGLTEVDPGRLRRARADELESRVTPDELHRWTEAQYAAHGARPYDARDELLWMEGSSPGGTATWVPASAVYLGLNDPGAPAAPAASSSGGAAGRDARDAAERAVLELIERDAFTWTWAQRLSRERIDPAGLPDPARELAGAVERAGFSVDLVNLTLETKPVVMAVLQSGERLHVALGSRDDPREAGAKALDEAALVLSSELPRTPPRLRPEEVVSPEDHMRLYLVPEHAERARFLAASPEVIEFGDVPCPADPATEVVRAIGEPVVVSLTTSSTAPFAVARAIVPGLLPVSYGWDREPRGLAALGEARATADGRRVGAAIDLDTPIMPHPFP